MTLGARSRQWSRLPRAAWLLVPVLAGLIASGWVLGLLVTHTFAGVIDAHVDLPVKGHFTHHQSAGLHRVMSDVTDAGDRRVVFVVALVGGAAVSARRRSWLPLLAMMAAVFGAYALTAGAKAAVRRGRPLETGGLTSFRGYSFPSGHTIQATAVYGALALLVLPGLRSTAWRAAVVAAAAGVALVVGFSRIYLDAHWVTDVVAGLLLGSAWAVAVARTLRR